MTHALFQTGVDAFIQKHIVRGRVTTKQEFAAVRLLGKETEAELFEQLLLFDRVAFKVVGENRVVPFLISLVGLKGFEALIDQDALEFTLWTPTVMHHITEAPGMLDPLVYGHHSTLSHCDPEESLEAGLTMMPKENALDRKIRRHLIRKLLPLCSTPRNMLAMEAVKLTHSAFESGKLRALGFAVAATDLRRLTLKQRAELSVCATELLEYNYVLESGKTSFANPRFYEMFHESTSRLAAAKRVPAGFAAIASIEHLPDLKSLFHASDAPFQDLPRLRGKSSSRRFRAWLESTTSGEGAAQLTREYIDALESPKGFFETKTGKITKAVVMGGAVGAAVGAAVSSAEEALKLAGAGAVVGGALSFTHPMADAALDALDELLLADVLKGWSPRMFCRDLRNLSPALPPDPWDKK